MFRNTAQKLLIIGGFIGLIFSKAEGVSLLPFHQAEVVISASVSQQSAGTNNNEYSYSQTVKTANSYTSHKGKTKNLEVADDSVFGYDTKVTISLLNSTPTQFRQIGDFPRQFLRTTSPRGPPFIS